MTTNRIAAIRRENGMNQKELGAALGVAQTTVSAWETGRNEPDSVSLGRMAKLFHTTIGYLMGLEPESYLQRRHRLEAEREELDDDAVEEYIWQDNMERWEKSGKPDTIEGFLVSEMVDSFPAAVRKEALNMMYSIKRAIAYKPE